MFKGRCIEIKDKKIIIQIEGEEYFKLKEINDKFLLEEINVETKEQNTLEITDDLVESTTVENEINIITPFTNVNYEVNAATIRVGVFFNINNLLARNIRVYYKKINYRFKNNIGYKFIATKIKFE
jgi:hypothetical protein